MPWYDLFSDFRVSAYYLNVSENINRNQRLVTRKLIIEA